MFDVPNHRPKTYYISFILITQTVPNNIRNFIIKFAVHLKSNLQLKISNGTIEANVLYVELALTSHTPGSINTWGKMNVCVYGECDLDIAYYSATCHIGHNM